MNAKYYPALQRSAAIADQVISRSPEVTRLKASSPAQLTPTVYNIMDGELGLDDKELALEVAKSIYYGYHVEVNAYYANL